MASGPGKYDEECTALLHALRAKAVVVVVIEGSRGSGFSLNYLADAADVVTTLPSVFRNVGDVIERDTTSVGRPISVGVAEVDPAGDDHGGA